MTSKRDSRPLIHQIQQTRRMALVDFPLDLVRSTQGADRQIEIG